jgi:hypothetical protein
MTMFSSLQSSARTAALISVSFRMRPFIRRPGHGYNHIDAVSKQSGVSLSAMGGLKCFFIYFNR